EIPGCALEDCRAPTVGGNGVCPGEVGVSGRRRPLVHVQGATADVSASIGHQCSGHGKRTIGVSAGNGKRIGAAETGETEVSHRRCPFMGTAAPGCENKKSKNGE